MATILEPPSSMAAAAPALRASRPVEDLPAAVERVSLILSKGTLDMAYPGLILANGARMGGIDVTLFFMLWGLDIVTRKTVDHLHLATVGNPSLRMPTLLGGLPGVESLATRRMKKEMRRLDVPPVRELVETLADSGAKLYACRMSLEMFGRTREELLPQVADVISAMDFFDRSAGAQIVFV
jgi:peroxiredoxin family protein